MESFSICCGGFLGFCSGSDAWAVLLRVWRIPLPEAPPGHVCIPRHSNSAWDLNLGRSFRKSCNTFVVSGLAAGFCLSAWFRCSLLPLHLNQWRCLLNPCNGKFLNMLRWISWVLFRFRCLGCSVGPFGSTPARSTSGTHLHSAAFQPCLGSEPRVQLLKVLQCVCRELVGFRIMRLCRVQMLPFTAASEPGNVLVESV